MSEGQVHQKPEGEIVDVQDDTIQPAQVQQVQNKSETSEENPTINEQLKGEGEGERKSSDNEQPFDTRESIEIVEKVEDAIQQTNTNEIIGLIEKTDNAGDVEKTAVGKSSDQTQAPIGGTTMPITETPEVSSTKNDNPPPKSVRSSRRPSYQSSRGYVGGYQNYGLTYLPYKSNFEPSEDARRRADEFFKTLKL